MINKTDGTEKLYDSRPYDKTFKAKIRKIEPAEDGAISLVLDRTVFFPEEGGQTSDTGSLGGYQVRHVSIEDGIIYHEVLCSADDLHEGDEVEGSIDWDHRFSNMQNHTGEHILSGLLHSDWESENVGFHLSDNTVTLDTSKLLKEDDITELERKANEIVYRDIPVECRYYRPDELEGIEYRSKKEFEEDVRLVTIPGVDICACCAPHVGRTGEIGIIKVIRAIKYKGGMRLTILSGRRAYEYLTAQQRTVEELSHKLSESPDNLPAAVDRLMRDIEGYRVEKLNAGKERLDRAIAGMENGGSSIIFTSEIDNTVQRRAVNTMIEICGSADGTGEKAPDYQGWGICGIFAGDDDNGYKYIVSFPGKDAREISKVMQEKLGARGGGSVEMVQGSVTAGEKEIMEVLKGSFGDIDGR
jgi:alanyl-tRNA synthetase